MNIKDVITEFDKTQKEQEQAQVETEVEKSSENVDPNPQEGEAKSDGEFVERINEEDESREVVNQEEKEDTEERLDEDTPKTIEEVEEEVEDDKEDDKEEDSEEEEPVEKSTEEETVEKAKLTDKEENERKKKETDKDKEDSLKDKDEDPKEDGNETDQNKPRKPKKDDKKKTEQVKKNDEDLAGLLEVVIKSYQQSVESQEALAARFDSLEKSIAGLRPVEEEVSKSLDEVSKKVEDEEVEDKAVGYVSKSASGVEEPVVTDNPEELAKEPTEATTFNYGEHNKQFMDKFQNDVKKDNLNRTEINNYRQAYLDVVEGQASKDSLDKLFNYING